MVEGHRPRKVDERRLLGTVPGPPRLGRVPELGRDMDYAAAAALGHYGNGVLGHQKCAVQVHVHGPPPVCERDLGQRG